MKDDILVKINQLKNSDIQNYLESKERLFLKTLMEKLSNNSTIELNENEKSYLDKMITKYKRFL